MLEIFIYIFVALAVIIFIALILPVKFFIKVTGGTDGELEISGKIMLFSGIAGSGILYCRDICRLNVFLYTWQIFSVNLKPIIDYFSGKEKKRKKEEVKPLKKKQPVLEQIKTYYHKIAENRGYFSTAFHDIREIVGIDLFSVNIKLGLSNPGLTGKIISIIYAINSILPHPFVITPSWDFTKIAFKGDLNIKVTFFSHKFWKKIIIRLPLIVTVFRKHKKQKQHTNNNLAVQEV